MGRLAAMLDGFEPMILSGPRSWIVHATMSAAPAITVIVSDTAWNAF